jgi:DNA-binding SARP family transcriptional activator
MNAPPPAIQLFLLGRFEVMRGERILRADAWTRRKAAALLQRLALECRLLKDQAIEFLWPEADPIAGANNLYRTLHALRQTLDTALGPSTAEATFSFQDGVLVLADAVWVDVAAFERLSAMHGSGVPALNAPTALDQPTIDQLRSALELYAGDLLPDERYTEWTQIPREALRRRHRETRLALAACARDAARDYTGAIALLTPLLAADPADEPVHRELMRLYALAGRRHEALRQYQACVDALAAELDLPPEPETAALYAQILSGELTPSSAPVPPSRTPPAPAALAAGPNPPLVGREAEIATLRTWLRTAWNGTGRTILLAGDAGVGKTCLALEILRIGASAGMTTLFGAAYEQEGQLAYQLFVEAFDRYLTEHRRPPDENPITHFKRHGFSDPQQEGWALFKAAATFLSDIGRHAPVILLVDDLHAADEASLRLFHYLSRQARAAPIILLATYRADAVTSMATPCGALLNALYREQLAETISLTPLAEEAVAAVMAHILGGMVTPQLVSTVFEITEGNPFFVQEITYALLKAGQVRENGGQWWLSPGAELRVPAGLGGLLRERVARLGPPVEAALSAAAVIGREVDFDVLRGVAALPDSTLLDALDAALAGCLLEETATGYRFRHPLIRRVLYDSLSRARRAWLHGQTATTIEALYARRPGGIEPYVEDLAFHYDVSDRRDRALAYLIQAGRKAARMYAFEIAVDYYERALALFDTPAVPPDPRRRFRLLESLGTYYKLLANTPKAVAAFECALQVSGPGWQPKPHDRARIHRLAAMDLLTAGRLDEAAAHLQRALAELGAGGDHEGELAHVLYNVAQLHWHRNEYREAFDVAQRSLAVAERLNEPAAIARAFEMLALACHSLGEWQTGISYEERRAALAGPGLDVSDAFDVHL